MLIKLYLISFFVLLGIDYLWLRLTSKRFYGVHLKQLFKPKMNWSVALIFYFMYIAGLTIFVLAPSLEKQSLTQALLLGSLFGLVCYGTYDLTNYATLRKWPLIVTVVDITWGVVLTATASGLTYLIASRLGL